MKRVLHITVRADRGGGPKHIIDLLTGLDGKVLNYIATPSIGEYVETFRTNSHDCCWLPPRQFQLVALFNLLRFIKRHNIEIIHSHGRGAGIYGRLAGMMSRIPVIHTHHGLYLEKYSGIIRILMVWLERILNGLSTKIVFVSQSEADACLSAGAFDKNKSVVIPNCVAIPAAIPCHNGRRADVFRFIAVTRLEREKGNVNLVDIAAKLRHHTRRFNLIIAGDGPEREILQERINTYGLEDLVMLIGGRDDVPQLMQNADAYITASHGEAHSIAMLEAMSYSLPIIASRVRGHTDMVIDGVNGLLFDLNDPVQTARKLLPLVQDTHLSARLGRNGRQTVSDNYSIGIMLDRVNLLYREVLLCDKQLFRNAQ